MNKIIPFVKVITLNDTVEELEKIALDDTLILSDPYTIKGDLIVRGCYKKSEGEEDFSYPIPVEIAIDSKYDTSKCNIKVDDFYYEIINEQDIRVKIDLILDELYYIEPALEKESLVLSDNRYDNLSSFDEIVPNIEISKDNKQIPNTILETPEIIKDINTNLVDNDNKENVNDLFKDLSDSKEYSVYRVYTICEGETLEYIMEKYKVNKDDLIPYNNLDNIKPGVKLIIPSTDE